VAFNVTDQLLISFLHSSVAREKWVTLRQYINYSLFIDFKTADDSVRRDVLYNILIEFGAPKKLARLINTRMSSNET
jgi:hypothetical protein